MDSPVWQARSYARRKDLNRRVGVVSCDFIARTNAEVADRLAREYGVLTRCGLHCAPNAHKVSGTFPQGTVRFSFSYANTAEENRYCPRRSRRNPK
jgi:selenocysteine lyase/cysteine desulfurase